MKADMKADMKAATHATFKANKKINNDTNVEGNQKAVIKVSMEAVETLSRQLWTQTEQNTLQIIIARSAAL